MKENFCVKRHFMLHVYLAKKIRKHLEAIGTGAK